MYLIQIKSYALMAYLLVSTRRSASVFVSQLVQRLKTQTKKYILSASTPTSLTKKKVSIEDRKSVV